MERYLDADLGAITRDIREDLKLLRAMPEHLDSLLAFIIFLHWRNFFRHVLAFEYHNVLNHPDMADRPNGKNGPTLDLEGRPSDVKNTHTHTSLQFSLVLY